MRLAFQGLEGTIDQGPAEGDPADEIPMNKLREEGVQKLLHMCYDTDEEYEAYLRAVYPVPIQMTTVHALMDRSRFRKRALAAQAPYRMECKGFGMNSRESRRVA